MSLLAGNIIMPLLSRPGTLVDVGANFGQSAQALLAVKESRVVAFEPVVQTYIGMCSLLAQAAGGKLPEHLTVYNLAVGAAVGVSSISIPYFDGHRWEGRASIVNDFGEMALHTDKVDVKYVTQDIVTVPLDLFAFQDVTFLKIDVEGYEKEVIDGAIDTITRCKPIIHIEIEEQHRKNATTEVPAQLSALGYRGFFFLDAMLKDFVDFDPKTMQMPPPLPRSGDPYPDPYIFEFVFVHDQDIWAMQRLAEIAGLLLNERLAAAGVTSQS